MTIRLFVSDVDGTLVNRAKALTPATIAAVARLRAAGLPFTVISARPPSGVLPIARALSLDGPVAAFNGGTIIAADGSIGARQQVPGEVIAGLFELAEGSGADPWLFVDGVWHLTDPANPHVPREKLSATQEGVVVDDLRPFFGRVDKLTFVSDEVERLADLERRAIEAYGSRATIGRSQAYFLDVTHLAANKGDGLAALAEAYGVDLDAVAVIGDMPNDLPMFARAALAIAMGQAPEDVRGRAARVTDSNEEDGVAHAIDEIIMPMMVSGEAHA